MYKNQIYQESNFKQLLDEAFAISGIIKVEVTVIRLRLITLTETGIIKVEVTVIWLRLITLTETGIIKVEVTVISRSRRLRLITLTETLIIPDIAKTGSNNCFIINTVNLHLQLYIYTYNC